MIELKILDVPKQTFSLMLNERSVRFDVLYNTISDRWTIDLWIDDELKLSGRKIVTGCDLVYAFNLGIGQIIAIDPSAKDLMPDRDNLPSGAVVLLQSTRTEMQELLHG